MYIEINVTKPQILVLYVLYVWDVIVVLCDSILVPHYG